MSQNKDGKQTVWVLQSGYIDPDGYEQFEFDSVYANYPTREQLEVKFKGYSLRSSFVSDLLEKKRADNYGRGGYDPWAFELEEVELL